MIRLISFQSSRNVKFIVPKPKSPCLSLITVLVQTGLLTLPVLATISAFSTASLFP